MLKDKEINSEIEINYDSEDSSVSFALIKKQIDFFTTLAKTVEKSDNNLIELRVEAIKGSYIPKYRSKYLQKPKTHFIEIEEEVYNPEETMSFLFLEFKKFINIFKSRKGWKFGKLRNSKNSFSSYEVFDLQTNEFVVEITPPLKSLIEKNHSLKKSVIFLEYANILEEILNDKNIKSEKITISYSIENKKKNIFELENKISNLEEEKKWLNDIFIEINDFEKDELENIWVDFDFVRLWKNDSHSIKINYNPDERKTPLSIMVKLGGELLEAHPTENKALVNMTVIKDKEGTILKILTAIFKRGHSNWKVKGNGDFFNKD